MGGIAGAACRVTFDSTPCDDTRVEQDVDDGIALNKGCVSSKAATG